MQFLPLGGAGDIGASCYYLNIAGTGIIVDAGLHPRHFGIEALPQFDLLHELPVDAGLITHAHQDHLSALPYLVQQHPYMRIITTPQTRGIAELTLHNSVSILQEQLKGDELLRPYEHEEVDMLVRSIEWKSYHESFDIRGYRHGSTTPIHGSFHDAGHILGAAGILLEHDGRTIYFTGDVNLTQQSIQPGAILPDRTVDTLVLECTHGATESVMLPEWEREAKAMAHRANQILALGGTILIPVFALGKLQEMLCTLWRLMEAGTLSRTDIYTGGVGRKINMAYDRNRYAVRRMDPEFELASVQQKDLYEIENLDELFRQPGIVLASSGMVVERTLSYRIASRCLRHANSGIFIVGYMDPETPGYRLSRSSRGDLIQLTNSAEPESVRCSIDRFRFTSHARREDLLTIVRRLQPSNVILVHGEEEAIHWIGSAILTEHPNMKVRAAEIGRSITLD
ncbi:MAG: MBL fold metallo-hydrolase [Ignavibacteriales bacterium]|nr:MBL fold metallo-hydrolase [Ignavibacteriales bacterium]